MTVEAPTVVESSWFYEFAGERKGPVPEEELVRLIHEKKITHGSAVWKKGFPDWLKVENTDLRKYLDDSSPPPLPAAHVNNTLVWVLAFAPIIGLMLEYFVAGAVYHDNEFAMNVAINTNKFWYITLFLNIGLSLLDLSRLKKAGHDTEKYNGWALIVPVYLYRRAKDLKENMAYFYVWIVCFILALLN